MSSSESRSGLVLELAEEFLERYRQGQRPALKEYVDRHPELADEIREVFPAMAMMENIALADESVGAETIDRIPASPSAPLKQLGDFRILRQVGRGGMGVVYEAEQVSLGRHVALKVLPQQMLSDAKQKQRFEREAKSAARLHHTNIVPVFGVGEHEGTPYYVMQFIQGLALDEVLDELKLMQGEKSTPAATISASEARILRRDVTAADVARSLMTGRFEQAEGISSGANGEAELEQTQAIEPDVITAPSTGTPRAHNGPHSDSFSLSSSSVSLLGKSASGRSRKSNAKNPTYWQSVAHIGIQVADALDYAHKQGILHRDIKPSNLLLDTRGTVWVTDFGLAKADDQQNLTHTGDILGTLRYMPPEAFEGRNDLRGDIYSLGLTLYELLAFRPAFNEKDRGRLIRQVTNEDPVRLERINREIPRDLETIVHKAIDRDPSHRYATAEELAADLQRFLDDEPILARRLTQAERLGRSIRRNPVMAGLIGLVALLVVAIGIVGSGAAIYYWRIAERESEAAARERAARHEATALRKAADEARRKAEFNFSQARAAVNDSFTTISESQLLKVPALHSLRQDLLRSALRYDEQFLKDRGDDPSLQGELAATYHRIGQIDIDLGQEAEGRKALESAVSLCQQALERDPVNLRLQELLGDSWQALGDMDFQLSESQNALMSAARIARMVNAFEHAVTLREALLKRDPDSFSYANKLSIGLNRLGLAQGMAQTPQDTIQAYRRATEIRFDLLRRYPDDPVIHYGVGESLCNLGEIVRRNGAPSEALLLFQTAKAHYELACAKLPHVLEYGIDLALLHQQCAFICLGLGRDAEALEMMQKGIQRLYTMFEATPNVPLIQNRLFGAIQALIATQRRLHDLKGASETLKLVRSIIERLPRETGDDRFLLARALARYRAMLGAIDEGLSDAEKTAREKLPAEILAALEAAVAAGYADIEEFRNNRDLTPIHSRSEYKSLLARMESRLHNASTRSANHQGRAATRETMQAPLDTAPGEPDHADLNAEFVASLTAIGFVFEKEGRQDEATKLFDQALNVSRELVRKDPKALGPQVTLACAELATARFHWRNGRFAQAAQLWRKDRSAIVSALKETAGKSPLAVHFRLAVSELAEDLAWSGMWEEAEDRFAELQSVAGADQGQGQRGPLFSLAILKKRGGDETAFRTLCAKLGDSARSSGNERDNWLLAEGLKAGDSRIPEAAQDAAYQSGKSVQKREIQALILFRMGRFAESFAIAQTITKEPPLWLPPLVAMIHQKMGQADEARKALESCHAASWGLFASNDSINSDLYRRTVPRSDWREILPFEALYREAALLIEGKTPSSLAVSEAHRGFLFGKIGDTARSEEYLAAAVATRPEDAAVWLARAWAYELLGRQDVADADVATAQKKKISDQSIWIAQGRFLAERGKHDQADVFFARAAAAFHDDLNRFIEAGCWVTGPFPSDLRLIYPPEREADPAKPVPAADPGSAAPRTWRSIFPDEFGQLDLSRFNGSSQDSAAYVLTYVSAPEERTATLMIRANGPLRVWLNGRLVHETQIPVDWHFDLDRVPVVFQRGRNTLLAKTTGRHLYLRLGDSWFDRMNQLTELGLFQEAAAKFRERNFKTRSPLWHWLWMREALVQLGCGDLDGYDRSCAMMLQPLPETNDLFVKLDCAIALNMTARSQADRSQLLAYVEQWFETTDHDNWKRLPLALAYYRAGKLETTENVLAEYGKDPNLYSLSHPLHALVQLKLGRVDEARQSLAKAEAWFEDSLKQSLARPSVQPVLKPLELTIFRQLLLEARAALGQTASPSDSLFEQYQNRVRDALRILDKETAEFDVAVMLNPWNARYFIARGLRHAELGHEEKMQADVAKAISLRSDDSQLWLEFVRFVCNREPNDRSLELLSQALLRFPEYFATNTARHSSDAELRFWERAFEKAATASSRSAAFENVRAHFYADLSLIEDAARAAGQAFTPGAKLGPMQWERIAPIWLLSGDAAAYARHCASLRALYREPANLFEGSVLAGAYCAGPNGAEDYEQVAQMADVDIHAVPTGPWRLVIAGMAHYRAGHYGVAVERVKECLDADPKYSIGLPVMAMAQYQLGHSEEAKQALRKADDWLDQCVRQAISGEGDNPPMFYSDWLRFLQLHREAHRLINGSDAAARRMLEPLQKESARRLGRGLTAEAAGRDRPPKRGKNGFQRDSTFLSHHEKADGSQGGAAGEAEATFPN